MRWCDQDLQRALQILFSFLDTQEDYISQPPLQVGGTMWLINDHWDVGRSALRNVLQEGFPGGPVVKNLPVDSEDLGSVAGLGRFHMPWSY